LLVSIRAWIVLTSGFRVSNAASIWQAESNH
jgi:hypothetical protein